MSDEAVPGQPQQPPEISMMRKIANLLRAKRQDVPEEASKVLPEPVMPRKAVEQKRARLQRLDEETKE